MVGLLEKPRDRVGLFRAVERGTDLDVAEARFGVRRRHAERHQHVGPLRDVERVAQRRPEGCRVRNDVVRRQHRHHRLRRARRDAERRERDCGGGVPSLRLDEHVPARQARAPRGGRRRVRCARDDQRAGARHERREPGERVGEERAPAGDREQLLRHTSAAARPEPRPGSSSHHHRVTSDSLHRCGLGARLDLRAVLPKGKVVARSS
jgi:hypothetical protein